MRRMVTRATVALGGGVVAAALGCLAGAAMSAAREAPTHDVAPDCPARARPPAPAVPPEAHVAPRGAPAAPDDRLTWAECLAQARSAELDQGARLRADLAARAGIDGDRPPLAWAEPPPLDLTDRGFAALLERAIADCGVDAEIAVVDCSEPPCLAALTTLDTHLAADDFLACAGPLFQGAHPLVSSEPLACPGGIPGKALLVAPALDAVRAHGGVIAPHDAGQAAARRFRRMEVLRTGLPCPVSR